MFVHLTLLLLSYGTLSNEIFCGSFWSKVLLFVCACLKSVILFNNHNVLVYYVDVSASDLSGVVLWNPFKWDILWFISDQKSCYLCAYHISKTNFIPQPQEQKTCRRHIQWSSTLCECLCTQLIRYYCLQHFQIRYFLVHFDQKSCYLCAYHISKTIFFPNHRDRKVARDKHNVLIHFVDACAPNLFGVIICNPFIIWDI